MNFISIKAEIIPKELNGFTYDNILKLLLFKCNIHLLHKESIVDEFGIIDIEHHCFNADGDIYNMRKIQMDCEDEICSYIEDYNVFNLDTYKIIDALKNTGFRYNLQSKERVIFDGDVVKIKKLLDILMAMCVITKGFVVIEESIGNFVSKGIYDIDLLRKNITANPILDNL